MDEDELPEDDPEYVRDSFGTFVVLVIALLTLFGALLYHFWQ